VVRHGNIARLKSTIALVLVVLIVATAALFALRGARSMPASSGALPSSVLEDFGTGIDLLHISYGSSIAVPANLRIMKDETYGYMRGIYLEDSESGDGVKLLLGPDSVRELGVGRAGGPSFLPELRTSARSPFVTAKGIRLGASLEEVIAAYGEAQPQKHSTIPDMEFLNYRSKVPGGLVATLGFVFENRILVGMNSHLYSPREREKWDRTPPAERGTKDRQLKSGLQRGEQSVP